MNQRHEAGDPTMTLLSQLARRRPVLSYFVLVYGLSWALWIPLSVMRDASVHGYGALAIGLGSSVPSAVAIALTAFTLGRSGTRELLRQLLVWRTGAHWYLLLLAPTALVVAAITVVAVLRGGPTATLAVPL